MINADADGLIDFVEQPISNEIELNDSKYHDMLINVDDEKIISAEESNMLVGNEALYVEEQPASVVLEQKEATHLKMISNENKGNIDIEEQPESNILEPRDHNHLTMISNEKASEEIALEEQPKSIILEPRDHNHLTIISNERAAVEIALEELLDYATHLKMISNENKGNIDIEEQPESTRLEPRDHNDLTMISNERASEEIALEEQPKSNEVKH